MSMAGIDATSFVELPKAVARLLPFHCTTEAGKKSEPSTVRVTSPVPTPAADGERELTRGTGLIMLTKADPSSVGSVTLVATTVTAFGEGTSVGAVYRPVTLIVPTMEFPPAVPFTDHFTVELSVLLIFAVNWTLLPIVTRASDGETDTTTGGCARRGGEPHPSRARGKTPTIERSSVL
jgi:hypothetical protein